MDFDFGNLIYIILTLVFVIFGAMNKKKKKVVQTPSEVLDEEMDPVAERPVSSVNENLKKLFGDFMDVDQDIQSNEIEYEEEYSEEESPVFESILDTDYSKLNKVEKEEEVSSVYHLEDHMDSIRLANAKSIAQNTTKTASFTMMLSKEFDPKKAILYSEIFKPKYF